MKIVFDRNSESCFALLCFAKALCKRKVTMQAKSYYEISLVPKNGNVENRTKKNSFQ
jgi:hypothetical protein